MVGNRLGVKRSADLQPKSCSGLHSAVRRIIDLWGRGEGDFSEEQPHTTWLRRRAKVIVVLRRVLARRLRDVADDGLTALTDRHMLHDYLLLTAGAIAFQRLHLRREGSRQLVEGALGAVLPRSPNMSRRQKNSPRSRSSRHSGPHRLIRTRRGPSARFVSRR